MKRTFFLFLTILVLFGSSEITAAQKFLPKTIQFKGAPEYSDQELLAAAGLQKGKILAFADMKDHSQKLMDSGVFETLSFKFDGVDLIYTLVPHTELYSVRLDNLPLTPGKELDSALHDRFPLYHGKVPAEGGMTEQVRQALEEMLAAKGIKATIAAMPYTGLKLHEVTAISYSITTPAVRLGELHLEGVSPEMQDKVKAVADRTRKNSYDTESSAGSIEHTFALFYAEEGYAAVNVHAEQSGNPVVSSDAIEIPFNVNVKEGLHYKLGSIHLPSGELLMMDAINKTAGAISYKSGGMSETMSVKGGVALRTALIYVTGDCKSKGYMDCVVTPHPQYDDANGIVNYNFEVQTGPMYTMGKLTIENVSDDLRDKMTAAWKMPFGSVFSVKAIREYYYSQGDKTPLGRTFASVNCSYTLAANTVTHIVDVTLHLDRKQ